MRVTILRGISGSGKTTWAKQHAHEALILSTDDYFMVDGVYQHDVSLLETYHRRCFHEFLEAILRQEPWIIVDNTNVRAWEFSPYVLAAEAYGYQAELVSFRCSIETAYARKQLLDQDHLARTHAWFEQETTHLPKRFRGIHTVIETTTSSFG